MVKTIIIEDQKYVDMVDRQLILWGAGWTAQRISLELQLDEIAYVIDSDENKQETEVALFGQKYKISAPSVLNDLCGNEYYIFIASNYVQEIVDTIRRQWGNKFHICKNEKFFCREYSSLTEMLLIDPVAHKKITQANISRRLEYYINKADQIINEVLADDTDKIEGFIPISEGHKVNCIIVCKTVSYILSMPNKAGGARWHVSFTDDDTIKKVYKLKQELEINKELTLYEDEEGFRIEYFADGIVDLQKEETICNVLDILKKVHNSGKRIDITGDVCERAYEMQKMIRCDNAYYEESKKLLEDLKDIFNEIRSGETVLIHGDCHTGNVVQLQDKVFLIDWEGLCMSDPIYDICRLLFYRYDSEAYQYLNKWLEIYYGTKPTKDKVVHAYAMMIYCEYIEYLLKILAKIDAREKGIKIKEHIITFSTIRGEGLDGYK